MSSQTAATIFSTRALKAERLRLAQIEREVLERHDQVADVLSADVQAFAAAAADEAVERRAFDAKRLPAPGCLQALVRDVVRCLAFAAAFVLWAVAFDDVAALGAELSSHNSIGPWNGQCHTSMAASRVIAYGQPRARARALGRVDAW
jgi:hypothetical protein